MRHPELYTNDGYAPVFKDVETELAMWKTAEKINKLIEKGHYDWRQLMFIMHYVMCLQGMDDDEIYKHHAWMLFKTSQSQAGQTIKEHFGYSAKQLAEKRLKKK